MIEGHRSQLEREGSNRSDISSNTRDPIGVIGLGLLGGSLAGRLDEHGYTVYGYDKNAASPGRVDFLESAKAVFEKCPTVIFSLPESSDVAEVLQGVDDVLIPKHHTVVDTTTGDPDEMRRFYELLKRRDIEYIEANVAGSSEAAKAGDAPLFLGGDALAIGKRKDLFDAMSETSFRMGDAGAASKFKLVHNLLLGLNRAVLAETLEFGEALGFDKRLTLDVLKQTPASSYVMVTKGERMVQSDFQSPQARLSQHLKDVCLILAHAEQSGAQTPLSETHYRLLKELESLGYGECDNSAIVAAYRSSD